KLLGIACPCLEGKGDGPARRAAWAISSVPIRWHRRPRPTSTSSHPASPSVGGATATMGGFLATIMFGGGECGDGGGGSYSSSRVAVVPLVGATLSVVDSPRGPSLVASPPQSSSSSSGIGAIRQKCIPLRNIRGVVRERDGIAVTDMAGRTVLRFDVLTRRSTASDVDDDDDDDGRESVGGGGSGEDRWNDASASTADATMRHLISLMDWEKRRRDYITTLGVDDADVDVDDNDDDDVDEYDDDDNTTPSSPRSIGRKGVIAEQAQKIKHFAQREIEMQRLKKERESRKARYVKEAGGLKYTAIAMANRS
ncbi:hypothetical protein ACHAXA_007994, partial [Cyclostephanos tholiformis]